VRGLAAALLLALALLPACRKHPPPEPRFVDLEQPGQIPEPVLAEAAQEHGGSFQSAEPSGPGAPNDAGTALVLGPVVAEKVPPRLNPPSGDAGSAVREVIGAGLAADPGLRLVDAPLERLVDDSPRPDLARRGVRYVVKGTVHYEEDSDQVKVFLRAVETKTGSVAAAASGAAPKVDAAAEQATERLVRNLARRLEGRSGIGGNL